MSKQSSKREERLINISPYLKLAKIERLTDNETLELLEEKGYKISQATLTRYKNEYLKGNTARFLQIARNEWADEHLLIIDKYKQIEAQYWKLYHECEEKMDGKHILDSLSNLQEKFLLIYNEVPIVSKIRDSLDEEMASLVELEKNLKK